MTHKHDYEELFLFKADEPTETNSAGGSQSAIPYRFDLIDSHAIQALAFRLKKGAEKYGIENWKLIPSDSHLNHALNHIYAHLATKNLQEKEDQEEVDDHLAGAFCRLMMAYAIQKEEKKDRSPVMSIKSHFATLYTQISKHMADPEKYYDPMTRADVYFRSTKSSPRAYVAIALNRVENLKEELRIFKTRKLSTDYYQETPQREIQYFNPRATDTDTYNVINKEVRTKINLWLDKHEDMISQEG